jgi:fatty-acyl-CoA synthase
MRANPFVSDFLRGDRDASLRPQGGRAYVAGPADQPLRFITLSALLEETVAENGAADAAIFAATDNRWSWYDLRRRADEVAAGLLALGLQRGDRVAIWAPNCEEWLGTLFGAARIGAIVVGVDPGCSELQLEHALNQTQCRALIAARSVAGRDAVGILRDLLPELDRPLASDRLRATRIPRLRHVVLLGEAPVPAAARTFRALRRLAGPAQQARVAALAASVEGDDVGGIRFTRARDGPARAATHTHFSLANCALHAARTLHLTARDRVCLAAPLHHGVGLVLGALACAASGAAMVVCEPAPDAMLACIARFGCSVLQAAPAALPALIEQQRSRRADVSNLRTGLVAGACTAETLRGLRTELHLDEAVTSYGMTETNHLGLQCSIAEAGEARMALAGHVPPHMEAKIVDADGRIVPVGATGELCLRGYHLLRGFWSGAACSDIAVDAAGWIRTGDRALLNESGRCILAPPAN